MSSRQKIVAGNWKLNGTIESVVALAKGVAEGAGGLSCEAVICPVSLHINDVRQALGSTDVTLGAQNCSAAPSGAFTGEVSAGMLAEYGCRYVIVGHSERRALFGETNATVALKCETVQAAGLTPILCVGETLDEREADKVDVVIGAQLDAVVDHCGIDAFQNMVVAYEPVWAIGTGKTASPAQAQAVHKMIRERLARQNNSIADKLRILYGGSVKPDNAETLFAEADIDGGLIGGASLEAASFLPICLAAS